MNWCRCQDTVPSKEGHSWSLSQQYSPKLEELFTSATITGDLREGAGALGALRPATSVSQEVLDKAGNSRDAPSSRCLSNCPSDQRQSAPCPRGTSLIITVNPCLRLISSQFTNIHVWLNETLVGDASLIQYLSLLVAFGSDDTHHTVEWLSLKGKSCCGDKDNKRLPTQALYLSARLITVTLAIDQVLQIHREIFLCVDTDPTLAHHTDFRQNEQSDKIFICASRENSLHTLRFPLSMLMASRCQTRYLQLDCGCVCKTREMCFFLCFGSSPPNRLDEVLPIWEGTALCS